MKENLLMKALMKLLETIFGRQLSSDQNSFENMGSIVGECKTVEDKLLKSAIEAFDNDEVVKGYMKDVQLCMVESIRIQIEKGKLENTGNLALNAESLKSTIMDKIESLESRDKVKEAFQDYHNHDKDFLSNLMMEVDADLDKIMKDCHIENSQIISNVTSFATERVVAEMSKVPESPAKKAGIENEMSEDADLSKDNDLQINKDRNRNRDMEDENSPSMTP
jgi:hypothetical protein